MNLSVQGMEVVNKLCTVNVNFLLNKCIIFDCRLIKNSVTNRVSEISICSFSDIVDEGILHRIKAFACFCENPSVTLASELKNGYPVNSAVFQVF